ncbi:hypothetical protein BDV95DRAFT_259090 [Massariosphaeria phaeospora]|uniref:Uncharacterized protein n=1 Tax=Massariosphaeria phaeospora TaxID=100035 RepID=A0A7C8MBJ8_9PLEO|nr:hypothetical protein BDV95DRAFT_259090 [Massariosphaeria phaeospora]
MLETPVFRSMNPNGSISPSKILSYDCLNNLVKSVGQRAGYKERLSAYCFRRGYGNQIDKVSNTAVRKQLMGHRDNDTFKHYVSQVVGIDSQSLVLGRAQNQAFVDSQMSMMFKRNLCASVPPGSHLTDVPKPDLSTIRPINLRP